jgi:hypothetical protein
LPTEPPPVDRQEPSSDLAIDVNSSRVYEQKHVPLDANAALALVRHAGRGPDSRARVAAAIDCARRRNLVIGLAVGIAAFALTFGLSFGFAIIAFLSWCSSGGCD